MGDAILTLNAGSSSLKYALFEAAADRLERVADGEIERIGSAPEDLVTEILDWADGQLGGERLRAVGHRIVHGGAAFTRPVRIDAATVKALEELTPLAPLHQPHNLAAVRAVSKLRADVVQVACFDTAFHHGHAAEVDRFALPREWQADDLRRYGFHGLSYEYIAGRMRELDPALAAGRMVVAHLGNGASLCAIHDGRSVDTTMGLTALDGLVMGTRPGSLDPGLILHLQQARGLTAAALEDGLYRRAGLLGVSGLSGDMRDLLASPDSKAREAIDLFVFRIVRELGGMAASMGGFDGLVFTAGIGAKSAEIRGRVCERLRWLGVELEDAANQRGDGRISAQTSHVSVWALATDEERMIAAHASALIGAGSDQAASRWRIR